MPDREAMISTRKQTSQRHIQTAIELFHRGRIDCAITLALAGEGILPTTPDPHLFRGLKDAAPDLDLNLVGNWLKHPNEPDIVEIGEFEDVVMICRAITKFIAVFHQSCDPFEEFLTWADNAGHPLGRGPRPS